MQTTDTILSIDQGTTGATVILFDRQGQPVAKGYREFMQHYPQPGWVEHDPEEIWAVTLEAIGEALAKAPNACPAAVGITNQRETTVIWDRQTGKPIHPAIVWQCRRTSPDCDRLKEAGLAEVIRQKTGLVVDAYFSGTKIAWLLDHVPQARARAEEGRLCFGTIDSWLLWKLTGGKAHVTDVTNASRTMLYNIHSLRWDEELCRALRIPASLLPETRPSSDIYGHTEGVGSLPAGLPIAGIAGDQQAALFGQACFQAGMAKNTYGTGCFLLMNTGERPVPSEKGLLTTLAWQVGSRVEYALEGSVFIAGAAIQWLRDGLKLIAEAAETEKMAESIPDTGGVYLVPAFVGLGAPYWDMYARGTLTGLTRGTGREHLARAALEAIAYQTRDVLDTMTAESGIILQELRADGGATANRFLMQFQADLLDVPVALPTVTETTAQGAAFLSGLAVGFWESREEVASIWQAGRRFEPVMPEDERETLYSGWRQAVRKAML
ncbi:MAG: glycerol kinase GlpK [Armatimonadetes bacterium]|nr:glycerol kinase GlpK [Armatimonadota bacterium]